MQPLPYATCSNKVEMLARYMYLKTLMQDHWPEHVPVPRSSSCIHWRYGKVTSKVAFDTHWLWDSHQTQLSSASKQFLQVCRRWQRSTLGLCDEQMSKRKWEPYHIELQQINIDLMTFWLKISQLLLGACMHFKKFCHVVGVAPPPSVFGWKKKPCSAHVHESYPWLSLPHWGLTLTKSGEGRVQGLD